MKVYFNDTGELCVEAENMVEDLAFKEWARKDHQVYVMGLKQP